jgi:glycosyltransferase involved in cell wall biosynthesis
MTRLQASAIIPTYNHTRFVAAAVESALAQTRPPLEVIVVDDGSTDDTPAVLQSFAARVRAVRQPNRGVAAARNAGAALATGDVLAFLDADDEWLPEKLESQIARLEAEPSLGLVHCGVEEVDAAGAVLGRRIDGLEGAAVEEELLLFRRSVILGGGSGALFPRALFEALKGYDESLSTSADWDLFFRAARARPVGFVPHVLMRYRVHGSNMHGNVGLMARDMLRAYAKVFAQPDARLRDLEPRAYGALHSMLSGSYLHAGAVGPGLRHAVQALRHDPARLGYFLQLPLRMAKRRGSGGAV